MSTTFRCMKTWITEKSDDRHLCSCRHVVAMVLTLDSEPSRCMYKIQVYIVCALMFELFLYINARNMGLMCQ